MFLKKKCTPRENSCKSNVANNIKDMLLQFLLKIYICNF